MIPLPLGLAVAVAHPRTRPDLAARIGWHGAAVEPGAVWIHAASVGEVAAAEALWRALPRSTPKLLTADTAEGLAVARRFAGAACALLPVDHLWTLSPLFADARPCAVVFVEGTWWPALARLARQRGVPVVRVSAKAGRRTRQVPRALLRRWWRDASWVAARDEAERAFLATVHDCPVHTLGDLKTSVRPAPSPLTWRRPFVVGASLRDGDLQRLRSARPAGHQLLVAPRHPGRAAVPDDAVRRSSLEDGAVPEEAAVVWLDTLGELASCIEGAAAVFVGGTFDPRIGGHSPREAQAWGVPVVAGPCIHSAPEAFARARIVPSAEALAVALADVVTQAPGPRPSSAVAEELAQQLLARAGPPAAEHSPRPWARPFTPLVRMGMAWQATRHRTARARLEVPVISVGSTNARSPGRTSSVRWLVAELASRGQRVGVATRGYRRARPGRDVRGSWTSHAADDLGDEGALLARCGAVVAASPDRVAAGRALVAQGCTVVLLDDGLQHRRLHRDVDLVVLDARFPRARGLLPAGERREREAVPRRADVVWVHHGSAVFRAPGVPVTRRLGGWTRAGVPTEAPDGPVAWFCGVGHPAQVLATWQGPVAEVWVAPDHHVPDPDRIRDLAARHPLVTTAKDLERLPTDLRPRAWVCELTLDVPDVPWLDEVLR